jgi:hypothetical protein
MLIRVNDFGGVVISAYVDDLYFHRNYAYGYSRKEAIEHFKNYVNCELKKEVLC